MKSSLVRIAENILLALDCFLLFLLFFENKIVLPAWLQSVGRMHPLLLHFPIVILILALLLEFFNVKSRYAAERFYQDFADSLLLIGTITAAITAIMGMFLSKEEGYSGSVVQWHKVGGVSVVFFASLVYWCRNATWLKPAAMKIATVFTFLAIVAASHFGSVITHGEHFILAPVIPEKSQEVPANEALVFNDLIKPVFDQRCAGCHNAKKEKGSLLLLDSVRVVKGGKSGRLFEPGHPEVSLLLERIHLPLEEKKHMPPAGKPQLTEDEKNLLYFWIKSGAAFNKRIIDFPATDSFRILALSRLESSGGEQEQFHFAAADEDQIKKLNNNYRVVAPIARESPALAVRFYSRSAYSLKALQELMPVKNQIISLDLNKLPVKNDQLRIIGEFSNLRVLNLNFSDVTSAGLKELLPLQQLRELSVAGTKMEVRDLKKIADLPGLSRLTVWNTGLREADVKLLRSTHPGLEIVLGYRDDGKDSVRLNVPVFKNETDPGSAIFVGQHLLLHLAHPLKGVDIRYTTNGKEPDSISPRFDSDTLLTQTSIIKARAYKPGWVPSETASFQFYSSTVKKPDSVYLMAAPSESHKGTGGATFVDHLAGDFNYATDKWIGFKERDMEVIFEYRQPVSITSVGLHLMSNTGAIVHPPAVIEIWGGKERNRLKLLSVNTPTQPGKKDKPALYLINCSWKPAALSYLKIIAKRVSRSMVHQQSKDQHAWILVDEIVVN